VNNLLKKLYQAFSSKDTKTIEIYFEFLNVWWLFYLWNPDTKMAFNVTSPFYLYVLGIWTGVLLTAATVALVSKKLFIRLAVILAYVMFYLLTGWNIIYNDPSNPLGGIFICQGLLAAFLLWKIRAKQSMQE